MHYSVTTGIFALLGIVRIYLKVLVYSSVVVHTNEEDNCSLSEFILCDFKSILTIKQFLYTWSPEIFLNLIENNKQTILVFITFFFYFKIIFGKKVAKNFFVV